MKLLTEIREIEKKVSLIKSKLKAIFIDYGYEMTKIIQKFKKEIEPIIKMYKSEHFDYTIKNTICKDPFFVKMFHFSKKTPPLLCHNMKAIAKNEK